MARSPHHHFTEINLMSVTSTSGASLSADKRVLNRQVTAGLHTGPRADRDLTHRAASWWGGTSPHKNTSLSTLQRRPIIFIYKMA